MVVRGLALSVALVLVSACSGGSSSGGGDFRLIEFLESGQDNIPRNRSLTFRFSSAVGTSQDFFERLKIENVQTGPGQSNFARAIGSYVIDAERVQFTPRLPTKPDRSDAGFRKNGSYVVFLKAGPDALSSEGGSRITLQQEFLFGTNQYFEDPIPDPPRVLGLVARDGTQTIDLSRLVADPSDLSAADNNDLITSSRVIDPGPGGAPYVSQWEFDLVISEPIDPQTVNTENVRMTEIFSDATTTSDTDANVAAPAGHFGTPVSFGVPLQVSVVQGTNQDGEIEVAIRVKVMTTLVDDTRYRIRFAGNILGLDFRKSFIGENGLTGDGLTIPEPGGFGYVAEFIVRDRPSVQSTRTLTYAPLIDGINPEAGQTTLDEDLFNSALYDPPSNPGEAVGFVGAFGSGKDGPLAVTSGTLTLDTGDTPNELAEDVLPITVTDLDPTDSYKNTPGLPAPGTRTFEPVIPTEFDYELITIAAGARLKIIGVNPARILSAGLVQIDGIIEASGGPGGNGNLSQSPSGPNAAPGAAGPGGFAGGEAKRGKKGGGYCFSGCQNFDAWVTISGGKPSAYPKSFKGEGPGRGHQGGEASVVYQQDAASIGTPSGTGGGGGSHGGAGIFGEDRHSAGQAPGSIGKCSRWGIANSSLVGLRGASGATYGDREALDFTGGSGAGAGGAIQGFNNGNSAVGAGGGGGGGGGFLEILSAGDIIVSSSGIVDVSGGAGGTGKLLKHASNNWTAVSGSGGGGSGGTLSLISGSAINLTGGMLDARGGTGGPRPTSSSYTGNCNACNAGGDGGMGFIFLMDADGVIVGVTPGPPNPGEPGNYDGYDTGILTIRPFDVNRFGGAAAVTELFSVQAADPRYLPITSTDILATATGDQSIIIEVSSAKPDAENPLLPNATAESPSFEVAVVSAVAGGTVVDVTGDMEDLNPSGVPARDAFIRVVATFIYLDPKEAALGPFLRIDEFNAHFTFN